MTGDPVRDPGKGRVRVVLDTNVLVSAALRPRGTPGRCLGAATDVGVALLSQETAEELAEVLLREKFDRYASVQSREVFLRSFIEEAEVVEVAEGIKACRDPDDDKFLEAAVSGEADYLVTGDEDLLVLHPFRGIPILTPAAFLEAVEAEG